MGEAIYLGKKLNKDFWSCPLLVMNRDFSGIDNSVFNSSIYTCFLVGFKPYPCEGNSIEVLWDLNH